MDVYARWMIAVVSVALVLGLLIWARGTEHHRGNQVGSAPSHSYSATRTG